MDDWNSRPKAEGRVGRAIISNDDIYYYILAELKKKSFWRGSLFPPPPPIIIIHPMTWLKRGLLSCLPAVCNLVFYLKGYDGPCQTLSDPPYIFTYRDTSAL